MTRYKYLPLDIDRHEIRILNLLPGKLGSPICLSLLTLSFPDPKLPSFEALSYTWGSTENLLDVTIFSPDKTTLPITQNLSEILPYLRYEDQPRLLWIDALCINQQDLCERSNQVMRMGDIYSMAHRVIIWLGHEDDDTHLALECVSLIVSNITVDWGRTQMHIKPGCEDKQHFLGVAPFSERQYFALQTLFDSDWFQRLWIWQEARLGSAATVVVRGTQHALWEDIRCAIFYLCWTRYPTDLSPSLIDFFNNLQLNAYSLCQQQKQGHFRSLLRDTRHCMCTDPRDRVFALLSLCGGDLDENLEILPDYTKTVAEIYKEALLCHIKASAALFLEDYSPENHLPGASSWVPNWNSQRTTGSPIDHTFASLRTKAQAVELHQTLRVLGTRIALIHDTVSFDDPSEMATFDRMSVLQILLSKTVPHEKRTEYNKYTHAFCRMVIAGDCAEFYDPQSSYMSTTDDFKAVISYCLQNEPLEAEQFDTLTDGLSRFLGNFGLCARNRSIFITENGDLGLGPCTMQRGDNVVVLLGSPSVSILRAGFGENFTLVGQAYCDGFMKGEALLGAFPDDWDLVSRFDESSGHLRDMYINRATGVFQPEDPRLGELPTGWRRHPHPEEEQWTKFVHEKSGEEIEWGWDPRLSEEGLRDRGVALEYFDIV